MKKITYLLLFLLFSFAGFAQIGLPYTENFSTISVANGFPTVTGGAWTRSGTTANQPTYITNQATYNRSGNGDTKFMAFRYDSGTRYYFVGPFNLTAGSTYKPSVLYKADGLTGFGPLEITYGTTAAAATHTNTVVSIPASITNSAFATLTGNFSPATTGSFYIGIKCTANGNPWYLTIDDFSLSVLSVCTGTPSPGNTITSNAAPCAGNGFTLSLQNATSGSGVTYQWYKDAVAITGANSATYPASTNLPASYYCAVTCSGNTGNSTPVSITPTGLINTFPFLETFDATSPSIACWTVSSANTTNWSLSTAGTTNGPSAPAASTRFAYLNVYNAATAGNTYNIFSPTIALDATPKRLKYNYFLGTGGYQTTPIPLSIFISVNGGTFTSIYAHTSANSTFATASSSPWQSNIIDLTAYAGQNIKLAFVSNSNYGSGICDQGVDEVTVENQPSCLQPTALAGSFTPTNASLSWAAPTVAPANGYEWAFNTSATPPAITPGSGTTTAGLTAAVAGTYTSGQTYYLHVRSVCTTGTEYSTWSTKSLTVPAVFNDVCSGALPIACAGSINTSLVGSTNESQAVCGIAGVTTQNSAGIWYKFTGNGNDVTISTGSSATNVDTRLAIYSGSCGTLTCIGGNDDIGGGNFRSEVLFSATSGTDYYILLYSYSATSPTEAIILTATCVAPCTPTTNNDVCSTATAVSINTPLAANNTCSSPSGYAYPTCGSSFGTFYDTWYSFNSGTATSVEVSAIPTTTALVGYALYSGVCGTLTQVACSTTGALSTVTLTASTNYFVRVFSISPANRGDFTLLVKTPCLVPTALVTNVTSSATVNVSWTAPATAPGNGYEYAVTTSATPPASGTATANLAETVSGLSTGITYYLHVRSVCVTGNNYSNWVTSASFVTDLPDFVNLQWPVTSTVPAGTATTVYGRVYEAGLTDATSGQAPGILAWVGISPIGSNTNPNTWTTWVPATFNVEVGNDDEYQANIGAALVPGTYYYATRFQLNGGPFVYGGSNGDTVNGGGNFWNGTTINSGVLTINANPTQCATLVAPANATTGVFAGTVALSWTAPTSGPTPTGYKVYFGTTPNPTTLTATVTTLTYNASAPAYSTQYYWRVVPTSTVGGDATGCSEFSFTTQANPMAGYCTSAPTSNDGLGITNVTLGATNFPTGDVFYYYHGNTPVALNAGTLSNCQITFNTSIYDYDTHIWIDFNNNQVFDATEKVFTGVSSTTSPNTLNASFTIPASVLTGQYKMRIATADTGNPAPGNPCYSGTYGVTLDFTVDVTGLCSSTATWDGTMWTGTPSSTAVLVFNGNYTHTAGTTLNGCSCTINGTSVVTFNNGTLNLQNHLTTAAGTSLIMESGANLVQVNTTVANSVLGTFTAKRNSATMVRLDYTGWSSPVVGQNALAFSPATLTNRFYEYDPGANVYSVVDPTSTSFTAGKGLLVRAPNNWVAAPATAVAYPGLFTGVPNNGNVSPNVLVGYNLIGNPYPSPIDAGAFFSNTNNSNPVNRGITTMYFWTHTLSASGGTYATSNYATRNSAGGTAAAAGGVAPDGIIQVGQGFLVDVANAGTVEFNNGMRLATSNGQFFKTSGELNQPITIEKHRMWLDLTSPGSRHNQILVGYIEGATNGFEASLDARLFGQSNSVLYSPIGSNKFVIQSRALPFVTSDVVPLGLVAQTAGQYTITMSSFDGLFTGQDIFLRDNLLNITHDIKGAPYTFASTAGDISSRFEIVYASPLAVATPTFNENSVVIYTNESGININAGQTVIDSVKVFDVRGRLLVTKSKVNASSISIENVTTEKQVLIVQITSSDNVTISKKVIN